jgi:hypothetical protein
MKEAYSELIKKHNLPNVQQWIAVEDELTLTDLRAAFQEKLFSFADMLSLLLHPEDITAMVEAQVFGEEEREQMEDFYNRLMLLAKDCVLADIAATDAEELVLLRKIIAEWPPIVSQMKAIVAKTKNAYNGLKPGIHRVSYLG